MSYKHSIYGAVRLGTPGSDQAAQLGVLDYANSQLVTLTGSSQSATALPAGCYAARISAGTSDVHIRGDDVAATTAAPRLNAGQSEVFVSTTASRVFRLIGTASDTVTITPLLTTYVSVADDP